MAVQNKNKNTWITIAVIGAVLYFTKDKWMKLIKK